MADVGGDQLLPAPAVGAGEHRPRRRASANRVQNPDAHHSRTPAPDPSQPSIAAPMERTALRPGAPGVAAIARAARSQPGDRDVEVEMDALACVLGPHDVRLIMSAGCR